MRVRLILVLLVLVVSFISTACEEFNEEYQRIQREKEIKDTIPAGSEISKIDRTWMVFKYKNNCFLYRYAYRTSILARIDCEM